MPLLAPSILSADFTNLTHQIQLAEKGGADLIHCDIMDGHFVPNITFGPIIVSAAKKISKLPLDVHLMILNPDNYLEAFANAGAYYLTVHAEAVTHLNRTLARIKQLGMKAGVSLNPSTPVSSIRDVVEYIDLLLIMTVNPGFGGQSFIPNSHRRIKEAVNLRNEFNASFLIEVDGGISSENIESVQEAGCDIFVAGSSIFHAENITAAAAKLKHLITK
jgi:ribulose-phosphate 3-epimerase